MRNIVLVGFMGTGKTAVSGNIADILKIRLINTDGLIEKKAGMAIKDIFAKKGEPYFRKLEREAIKEVSKTEGSVIDAGGGVVIDASNIEELKKNGVIFCLNATPEEMLKRTEKHSHRPLLNLPDPLMQIKKILWDRREYYKRADYQIDTTGKSAGEVAKDIIAIYRSL